MKLVARRTVWQVAIVVGMGITGMACDASAVVQDTPPAAPLSLFAYDRAAPLEYQESPAPSPDPAVRMFSISYASPSGGRVTGLLAVPAASGTHAGVVSLHGLPGTAQQAMTHQGVAIAARGAVVIAIDAPWARRGSQPDFTPRDSSEQVQLIRDIQRAVDVLLARSDVDPARLAYQGGSYGGAMGALVMGIERRFRTGILFVPDGGLVAHFTNSNGTPIGPLAAQPPEAQERWLAAMRPIEPIRFVHLAAPTPLLFQNGRLDTAVAPEDAVALHQAAGNPKTITWYDSGHGLPASAAAERIAWLAQHVGIRP